jgi:hypothetical protein
MKELDKAQAQFCLGLKVWKMGFDFFTSIKIEKKFGRKKNLSYICSPKLS